MLPSLIVPAAAVKLPGEYLFVYLDSGCGVFCVGIVITMRFQSAYDRDVNPNRKNSEIGFAVIGTAALGPSHA